jgi:hypothetical protein
MPIVPPLGILNIPNATLRAGTVEANALSIQEISLNVTQNFDDIVHGNNITNTNIIVSNTLPSTSTTTGALTVAGGLGVAGNLYASNLIIQAVSVDGTPGLQNVTEVGPTTDQAVQFTNTTASTSATTGAVKIAGGLGVAGNVHVGEKLTVDGNVVAASNVEVQGALRLSNTSDSSVFVDFYTNGGGSSGWSPPTQIFNTATGRANTDLFGLAACISDDGSTIVCGASGYGGDKVGAAFVYSKSGSTVTQIAKLTASDAATGDEFGDDCRISPDGSVIVIGAPIKSSRTGAAYIYERPSDGVWVDATETKKLTGINSNSAFGYRIGISGDGSSIVVGAQEESTAQGRAYFFVKTTSSWSGYSSSYDATLKAASPTNGSYLFHDIELSYDGTVVAAGSVLNTEAMVFVKPSGGWSGIVNETQELTDGRTGGRIAARVAISRDNSLIAISRDDADISNNTNTGGVVVFRRATVPSNVSRWERAAYVESPDGNESYLGFGLAFSADDSRLLVTSLRDDTEGTDTGAVYVFKAPNWVYEAKLTPYGATGMGSATLGYLRPSMSSNGTLVQGAYNADNDYTDEGCYMIWEFTDTPTELQVSADVSVAGALAKQSGSFMIDHPLLHMKHSHNLYHSFIEGPKADLIYRGKIALVNGVSSINIDDEFKMTHGTFVALNRDVQCFTSNETSWENVRGNVNGNVLTIESENETSNAVVSWMVVGERQDEHMYSTKWTDVNGKVVPEQLKRI